MVDTSSTSEEAATPEFFFMKHRWTRCLHIAHVEPGRCVSAGFFRVVPSVSGLQSEPSPFPAHCVVWVYGTRGDAWRAIPGTAPAAWEPLMAAINTSTCLWLHSYVVPQNPARELTGPTVRLEVGSREEPLHLQLRESHPSHLLLTDFLYKSGNTTSEH